MAGEGLLEGIERAGANVAKDDPNGAQDQGFGVGGVWLGGHGTSLSKGNHADDVGDQQGGTPQAAVAGLEHHGDRLDHQGREDAPVAIESE